MKWPSLFSFEAEENAYQRELKKGWQPSFAWVPHSDGKTTFWLQRIEKRIIGRTSFLGSWTYIYRSPANKEVDSK